MKLRLKTGPTVEPVTLDVAKAYAKITHPLEDAIIPTLIAGARKTAEDYTRMSFLRQTWEATYEVPQVEGFDLLSESRTAKDFDRILEGVNLKRGPAVAVESIHAWNGGSAPVQMSADLYRLDGDKIYWNPSAWVFLSYYEFIKVTYTTGEPDAATFLAKHSNVADAILMIFTHRFENRGFSTQTMPIEAQVILNAYWKPHV